MKMSFDPPPKFAFLLDETNPGVMEAHCTVCRRLLVASRELQVLEIAQRFHICLRPAPENLQSN